MNFKNSLRLSTSDYALIIKSMVYRFLLFVIFFAATYALANDILLYCSKSNVFTQLNEHVRKSFFGFFKGENWHNGNLLKNDFKNSFTVIFKGISKHKVKTTLIFIFFFIYAFLSISADVSTTDIINNRMSVYSHAGFFGSFLRNFKTCITFGLFYFIYQTLFLVAIIFISVGFAFLLFNSIGMFTLPIIVFLILICLTLKQSLISQVLPSILVEKRGLWQVINKYRSLKDFKNIAPDYFIFYFAAFVVNVAVSVFTFGAGVIITVPLCHILLNTIGLVNYYETNKLKYYLSYNAVYKPQPYNESELFSDEN